MKSKFGFERDQYGMVGVKQFEETSNVSRFNCSRIGLTKLRIGVIGAFVYMCVWSLAFACYFGVRVCL